MDNLTRLSKLDETKYQALFGIQKPTFDAMLAILYDISKGCISDAVK